MKIAIVFDKFPGPVGPRFIEIEDDAGKSIRLGEWRERPDGNVELSITDADLQALAAVRP